MQNGLFDFDNRYASLSEAGDPLERLDAVIDWEIFRPILTGMDAKHRKSAAGRKPTCRVLMLKLLILQRLHGLSDEHLQYQVTDRLCFMRFLRLDLASDVPDARTVWVFREALKAHQLVEPPTRQSHACVPASSTCSGRWKTTWAASFYAASVRHVRK